MADRKRIKTRNVARTILTDPIAEFFNVWSGLLSFASILIGVITFFIQQRLEKKKELNELHDMIRRFCNTILTDLAAIEKAIIGESYPKKKIKVKQKDTQGKEVFILRESDTEVFLSTKVYESLTHSEVFSHFESETQTNLDELYFKIERNNDNLRRKTDAVISQDKYPQSKSALQGVVSNFETLMAGYQDEIRSFLDKAQKSIQKELEKINNVK